MTAMGHAYEQTAAAGPARADVPDAGVRDGGARDPRDTCATGYIELTETAAELAGVPRDEMWHFFAHGMMLNVVSMLELDWMPGEQ